MTPSSFLERSLDSPSPLAQEALATAARFKSKGISNSWNRGFRALALAWERKENLPAYREVEYKEVFGGDEEQVGTTSLRRARAPSLKDPKFYFQDDLF